MLSVPLVAMTSARSPCWFTTVFQPCSSTAVANRSALDLALAAADPTTGGLDTGEAALLDLAGVLGVDLVALAGLVAFLLGGVGVSDARARISSSRVIRVMPL